MARTVREAMTERPRTLGLDDTIVDAARAMRAEHQVRRLPVCEEDGRLVGMLAQADVARHADDARTGDTVQQISR